MKTRWSGGLAVVLLAGLTSCQETGGSSWSSLPRQGSARDTIAPPDSPPRRERETLRTDIALNPAGSDDVSLNLGAMAGSTAAAVRVLEQAASAPYAQLRANAIEAMHPLPDLAGTYAQQGLVDENRGVRFVAAMTIGRLKLSDQAHLVEPLLHDDSISVRAAAIYALRTCGQMVNLDPLADMLRSSDPEVRSNAAMVLGLLGDPSAAPMLEQAVNRQMKLASPARASAVELQLAESLFLLGKTEQVDTIRAKLYVTPESQELSAMAAVILGRIGDEGSIGALQRLVMASGDERRPAEVRLAAAMAMARLGQPIDMAWITEYLRNPNPEVRLQAALALGEVRSEASVEHLQRLLEDDHPLVQVAAARSILNLESGDR